jgi:hypothetical protein
LFILLYDNDHPLEKQVSRQDTCGSKQFKDDINQDDKNQNKRHKICLFLLGGTYTFFLSVDVKVREKKKKEREKMTFLLTRTTAGEFFLI